MDMHTRTSMRSSRLSWPVCITAAKVNFERTQKTLTVYKWNQITRYGPFGSVCTLSELRICKGQFTLL